MAGGGGGVDRGRAGKVTRQRSSNRKQQVSEILWIKIASGAVGHCSTTCAAEAMLCNQFWLPCGMLSRMHTGLGHAHQAVLHCNAGTSALARHSGHVHRWQQFQSKGWMQCCPWLYPASSRQHVRSHVALRLAHF